MFTKVPNWIVISPRDSLSVSSVKYAKQIYISKYGKINYPGMGFKKAQKWPKTEKEREREPLKSLP